MFLWELLFIKLDYVTRFGSFVQLMFRERLSFEQLSEILKYGNLNVKYGNLPQIGEKGNGWNILYGNFV